MQTSFGLTHIYTRMGTHTDAGNDNTQRPKLASGKNRKDSIKSQLKSHIASLLGACDVLSARVNGNNRDVNS